MSAPARRLADEQPLPDRGELERCVLEALLAAAREDRVGKMAVALGLAVSEPRPGGEA